MSNIDVQNKVSKVQKYNQTSVPNLHPYSLNKSIFIKYKCVNYLLVTINVAAFKSKIKFTYNKMEGE